MDIEAVISGCIQQDRKAQQRLYDLYYDTLMRTALFYCKNEPDAENIVMESFMYVYKNISSFKGESQLKTWMRRIVINRSISLYNKEIKRKNREIPIEAFDYSHPIITELNPWEEIEADHILKLIQELPDTERIVFNLYAIEGFSHKEIGEQLTLADSTCRWHYANARKRLQEKLERTTLKKIN